jgi:DNA-binding response OmpR family regulator
MLTAKAQQKDVEKGYEEGASFYIVKPFSNSTIKELTRYFLDDDSTEEQKEEIFFKLLSRPTMP